jgi:protein-disulfide isomerase
MPSGKASKQRRRANSPPPVRSKGSARGRQASPKVLIVGGIAAAAIVIAIVSAFAFSGGSSFSLAKVPTVGSLNGALPGAAQVDSLFAGIPQSGTTLGKSTAPVTMTEFIDPQCPYCQEFETQVLPSLVTDYVRSGKLRIQVEPWAFIGPDSVRGQAAELAAAQQNKFFNFAEVLYDNQGEEDSGWLTDSMIASIAASVPGLHVHTIFNTRDSSSVKAAQKRVDSLADTDKIDSTPTVYIGKTGTTGTKVNMTSATDKAAVVAAIEQTL